ncbi:MAG: hypothetical protein LAO51_03355 [Acidobacteriia bacterium]|nr:hypothetical protein [Terriglobia bacterium]
MDVGRLTEDQIADLLASDAGAALAAGFLTRPRASSSAESASSRLGSSGRDVGDAVATILFAEDYLRTVQTRWEGGEAAAATSAAPAPAPSKPPTLASPAPPPPDDIKLVELVEVWTESGAEKTAAPAGRKQYINLDEKVDAAKAHREYGRVVQFKARAEWVSGDKSKSLAGQPLYWYSTPGGGNKTGLTGSDAEGFDSAGGAKKTTVSLDAKGWTPVVSFYPSLYGGDEFKVSVTKDGGYKGGMTAGPYKVWRMFWYHVTEMKDGSGGKFDLPAGVTSAFEAGYNTVFAEFIEKTPRTEATHVDNLPTGTNRSDEAKNYFVAGSEAPFKCHIMTIDYAQTDNETKTVEDTLAGLTWTSPDWFFLWKFGGGAHPWKVAAQYQPKNGSFTDIPDAALSTSTLATQPGFKQVKVDLSSVSPAPARPLKIKLQIKVAGPGLALGWGGGSHHLFLCTGALRDSNVAADRDPTQKSDSVHEIGHSLGLVNMPPAPANAHDAWEDTGHTGHCKKPGTVCAMFWQSSTTRLTTFHLEGGKGCHDYLRGQDFSRSVMKDRWRD